MDSVAFSFLIALAPLAVYGVALWHNLGVALSVARPAAPIPRAPLASKGKRSHRKHRAF